MFPDAHRGGIPQRGGEGFDALPGTGRHQLRRQLAERLQYEGSLTKAGVRNHQTRLVDLAFAVEQEIEVERARRVARAAALAALTSLDLEQCFEQFARRQARANERHRIEVGTLLAGPHRRTFVDARGEDAMHPGQRAQSGEARRDVALALAEVRAERDVGDGVGGRIRLHAAMVQLHCSPVAPPADQPPLLRTDVPGPRSRALASRLAEVESRNVTHLGPPAPIFWERARGANVWDVDDNRYVDLSSAFGVSNVGHAHPRVVAAVAEQADRLLHGMGDVHPSAPKVALLEELVRRYPGGVPARAVLGSSGSDAVETALKSAQLASGRAGVVAFEGAYHGLAIGALDVTERSDFRAPFTERLAGATCFARYGDVADVLRAADLCPQPVGAVLVEPIQGRGGERVPPPGFLRELRTLCDERNWLLVADEVYTGFGRTGAWFACDHEGVVPDLLCVAKGLASGMPISACLGRESVMEAWPRSPGEALHTQTFLGHPPGCAAALASIAVLEEEKLIERAARVGTHAIERLKNALDGMSAVNEVRGLGLLIGVECADAGVARAAIAALLERGVIALPSGEEGRVIGLSPPLSIDEGVFDGALDAIAEVLR